MRPDVVVIPNPPIDASDPCANQGCGCGSSTGETCTVVSQTCVDGQLQCDCQCMPDPPPPPADAGDPCNPANPVCEASIPLSCFMILPDNPDGGSLTQQQCQTICPQPMNVTGCQVENSNGGPGAVNCFYACGTGRAFEGMTRVASSERSPIAAYLADVAYLESAAVEAFDILVQELEAHGAPAALVLAARTAREDEVRHARMTEKLAKARGASVHAPQGAPREVRALVDIAIDNAAEGCVRETFGALLAQHQGAHAADRSLRRAMKQIAEDETRHAELSWALAAWLDGRLTESERERVKEARDRAVEEVFASAAGEVPAEVEYLAGVPKPIVARAMLTSLRAELWSGAAQ
jgi:hypothetical protein